MNFAENDSALRVQICRKQVIHCVRLPVSTKISSHDCEMNCRSRRLRNLSACGTAVRSNFPTCLGENKERRALLCWQRAPSQKRKSKVSLDLRIRIIPSKRATRHHLQANRLSNSRLPLFLKCQFSAVQHGRC